MIVQVSVNHFYDLLCHTKSILIILTESSRPKRQKSGQSSRFEALAKLKKIKSDGTKNKYEVEPMQNVYEEVSEQEYTKRVEKRQKDNWIVDDCKTY